ncbi:MAG: hypothetical protein KTR31_04840 [Myxococcales bacterium]|nr:hypothetical protein [Myxococcales bacterium]
MPAGQVHRQIEEELQRRWPDALCHPSEFGEASYFVEVATGWPTLVGEVVPGSEQVTYLRDGTYFVTRALTSVPRDVALAELAGNLEESARREGRHGQVSWAWVEGTPIVEGGPVGELHALSYGDVVVEVRWICSEESAILEDISTSAGWRSVEMDVPTAILEVLTATEVDRDYSANRRS